ncbi:AP-3 complex subunit delta-1 isoform X2 [Bacillus rossius redtenbacheri]|uniref:AP-3 complex subunit delta-1 isoform X2 n=1 Tax=Bacillus rossius redtenbacheri TaxID=93214 RepID=UPI002FDEC629
MALRKVRGNLERMFDKNLTDLVRGIRNNKDNEAKYIAQCMEEIKQELRQDNIAVKANAVSKLTYLQMLGYDISWAGFNIIEVMSSAKFTYKRIGYLASSQCFHSDTELLMLTTNMIRKDLNSQGQYDAGLALSSLSCFISADLARDLANDIMTLLTSTKPYLRKKAVLMMYKVFLRFPEALRPAFPRLKEKLEDPDSGVQSAAVNVVCELARKNPKNYLSLAPVFFKLMTTSTNNWMLIKIIKLFGALTPLEPRLGKKLIEPLTNLIHRTHSAYRSGGNGCREPDSVVTVATEKHSLSTSAMSLLYECINTVIAVLISISSGMPNHSASIQLCVQKLRILIEDTDQNLKYLGLLAMSKILKTHPKSVQAHKDLIMQCLDDKDESIRLRALDLLYGMVSKKNLMEIVKKLMVHMDKAEGTTYRDELLSKIIQICSQNNYQYITNFEWYVSVLVELTRMEGSRHGALVATQTLDVAIRVQAIRQFAVQQMALLLENAHFLTSGSAQRSTMAEVLYAAAWICGEFSEHLTDPHVTLGAMLRGRVFSLPGHIQAVYVQNILKLLANILGSSDDVDRVNEVCEMVAGGLPQFVSSADLEVQERASSALQLVRYLQKQAGRGEGAALAAELAGLFVGELNPVAPKAQRKVQLPDGLDLDAWINDPPSESSTEEDQDSGNEIADIFVKSDRISDGYFGTNNRKVPELTEEEMEKRREARKLEQANNPHYLKSYQNNKSGSGFNSNGLDDYADIPVAEIDLPVALKIPGLASSDKYYNSESNKKHKKVKKKKRGKKGKVASSEEDEEEMEPSVDMATVVNTDIGEMPEGAQPSEGEDDDLRSVDDPHKALDINLDEPLRDEEKLPVPAHRVPEAVPLEKKQSKKHKQKDKKSKEHRKHAHKQQQREEAQKKAEDIDLWLCQDQSEYQEVTSDGERPSAVGAEIAANDDDDAAAVKKSKKDKKKSKDKEKKQKKEKEREKRKQVEAAAKDGYEEAAGISTPSKEVIGEGLLDGTPAPGGPSQPSAAATYARLAGDKTLELMFEPRLLPLETDQIVISVYISNLSTSLVKELDFMVSDTPTVKLVRGGSDSECGVKLPFHLAPRASSEAQFAFQVLDVTFPQKLRGTLTYMVETCDGVSTHEKLDFWLPLAVSSFLVGRLPQRDTVAELLAGGQLACRSSLQLGAAAEGEGGFSRLLARVCLQCRLVLVEQQDCTASLYSRSLRDHHVCLLVKSAGQLSVEGKSNSEPLLNSILSEIKGVLSAP